jgi:hypothetical protein
LPLLTHFEGWLTLPNWLGAGVLGALIALFSFLAKSLFELWSNIRRTHEARLASIIDLSILLNASRIAFLTQNSWASKLLQSLSENHSGETVERDGFETNFARLYDKFLPEETSHHELIRAWTEHFLRPINKAMLDWLSNDTLFRTTYISTKDEKKQALAEELIKLQIHLLLWECKYNAWIPNQPKHALVYLADEEEHGIGFPTGFDDLIADVISDLKKSAPKIPVIEDKRVQRLTKG